MKIQVLVGVIIALVTIYFTNFFADKAELKYSLSQKIESDFLTNKEEFGIQQLTLKNSGDLVINDIVIKIDSKILDFRVKKFANKDSIVTSSPNSNFELNYPKLPPMGEIIVLVKSSGINYENIEIYHSKGKAVEIFDNNTSIESYVFYALIFIYLIIITLSFRTTFTDSFKSKASFDSEKILKMKQPWYVDRNKWSEIRSIAVNNYFKKDYFSKIEKSSYYEYLNKKEEENLTEEEINKLNGIAFGLLTKSISDSISESYLTSDLAQLKSLNKPNNVSNQNWEDILKNVSKVTLTKTLNDLFNSDIDIYEERKVLKILENKKPPLLKEEDWEKLKVIVNNYYLAIVLTEIVKNEDYFGKVKWELIDKKNSEKLRGILDKIEDSKETKEYYSELLHILRTSFEWSSIPEKPELILKEDWSRIDILFNTVIQSKNNAESDLEEALEIKDEFYPLKEKVSKQLEIINAILNNPNSIDKVENYNIPFEKGNWENLLNLSELLKKK